MSFYKIAIILYTIAIPVKPVDSRCVKILDSPRCVFNVYCTQNFDNFFDGFQPYQYRRIQNSYEDRASYDDIDNDEEPHRRTCNIIKYQTNYEGSQFYAIHLKYENPNIVTIPQEPNEPPMLYPAIVPQNPLNVLITELDISCNNYQVIPDFTQMNNLASINVSHNLLTNAKLSNPVELTSLTQIDLSHNNIRYIEHGFGSVYKKLKKIDLSYNNLVQIPEDIFDVFNELESFDISHNYIEMLSPMTFEGMKQLKHLNMSFNRISDINSSLFRFTELIFLDLSNNNINTVKTKDFDKLVKLETLDLNSNLIAAIDKDSLHSMPFLQEINLKNNKLTKVDKETFKNFIVKSEFGMFPKKISTAIDVSDNNLKIIPKYLFKGKQIDIFSITNNHLEGGLENGMFEGLTVERLDLSYQYLESVQDYAFNNIFSLEELLLNNNNICALATNSFKTLRALKILDLSYNKIYNLDFAKDDLNSLVSFSLRKNNLSVVKHDNFHGLNSLQFLDLSDNKITQVETNSFESLWALINFQISNNPLIGILEESTFDGLSSLPSLDISCTLLTSIRNGSFIGMSQLKNLNVSHSKINNLEYNIFIHTGAIDTIDLSFNELKTFNINSSELNRLDTLYLNNNLLNTLDSYTFQNIESLSNLILSHNDLQTLDAEIFSNKKSLQYLDISFNPNLNLTSALLMAISVIDTLDLSGIKTGIYFNNIKDTSLKRLIVSKSNVTDIKKMHLNELRHLDYLNISYNEINKLEAGGFNNISTIRFLDLSHNKIKNIQPETFRDNRMLVSLNLSHNFLTDISYGVFHGLIYLTLLDISYNQVNDLQNERFYEVSSLSTLIADHNKIGSINAEEFVGTRLNRLSIGGNPIPCEILVNLKRHGVPFEITATNLYENNEENVNGVTCNKKFNLFDKVASINSTLANDNGKILLNIRDIMLDHFKNEQNSKLSTNVNESDLLNISNQIATLNRDIDTKLSQYIDFTANIIAENNKTNTLLNKISVQIGNTDTNVLLNKILKAIILNSATNAPPVRVTKDNATYENLLSYINKFKQDMEDSNKVDKYSIISELEAKFAAKFSDLESRVKNTTNLIAAEAPKHEKLSVSSDKTPVFTEICVALILVILVGFVLYKVYKSGAFVRSRFSVSTRELPGAMDSHL